MSINREADLPVLLVCQVAPVTDTDVVVAVSLGLTGHSINIIVDERANLVAIAYTSAVLNNGAVACLARNSLGEHQLSLGFLVHYQLRLALEAKIPHGSDLLGKILTEVLVESDFLSSYVSKRRLQVVAEITV